MQVMKRFFIGMTLVVMALQLSVVKISTAFAANVGSVVINEVAWMGSADNSNDEWIELYNTGNQAVDLSNWVIQDDGTTVYKITSGTIGPKGYFLIEDAEKAVNNVTADAVIGLSLANAGDSLVLKDAGGVVIDTVNGGGGAWYAGTSTTNATMERIDPKVLTDGASNWASATSGNNAVGSVGGAILGTPRSANSNYGGSGPEVNFSPEESVVRAGDTVKIAVEVNNAVDLYAYGIEVNYDEAMMDFVSAVEGDFLNADDVDTAFEATLEDGEEGLVVVGDARLMNPPEGLDGSGKLFELTFKMKASATGTGVLGFGGDSFLSDSSGDILAKFTNGSVKVGAGSSSLSVTNLTTNEGTERYSLNLSWTAQGATSFIVNRKDVDGNFVKIADVSGLSYVDKLDLVPGVEYEYQVIAVNEGQQSAPVVVIGKDERGVVGDNDRSDRVDGRDIERLARAYGSERGDEEYVALIDTNYDGVIDGSDLIDLGMNFGLTY